MYYILTQWIKLKTILNTFLLIGSGCIVTFRGRYHRYQYTKYTKVGNNERFTRFKMSVLLLILLQYRK